MGDCVDLRLLWWLLFPAFPPIELFSCGRPAEFEAAPAGAAELATAEVAVAMF